jgi:hypothetical protein
VKNDYNISPSRYIHTSDAETYRPIAEIVEELEGIEAEARETDKALRKHPETTGRVGMKKKPDNKETSLTRSSAAEYLTFITAKGEGGVEAIYADEDVWLSQKMMAVLYDVDVRTINYHLQKAFKDSELAEESVIRNFG